MAFVPYKIGKRDRPFKAIFWGDPGMGKTTFAASGASHPALKGMLFLNIEDGLLSIPDGTDASAIDIGFDESGKRVPVIDGLEKVMDELLAPNPKPEWKGFNTIVIDSVSDLQVKSLQDIVSEDDKAKDKDAIGQNHYGKDTNRMKRIFSNLRSCKLNVIFTALPSFKMSKPPKGEDAVLLSVQPMLTDKVAMSLVGYVDFSWYFYQDSSGKYKILTRPKNKIKAKTRNDKIAELIGEIIEIPKGEENLSNIYSKIAHLLKAGDE